MLGQITFWGIPEEYHYLCSYITKCFEPNGVSIKSTKSITGLTRYSYKDESYETIYTLKGPVQKYLGKRIIHRFYFLHRGIQIIAEERDGSLDLTYEYNSSDFGSIVTERSYELCLTQ